MKDLSLDDEERGKVENKNGNVGGGATAFRKDEW
jgi:hypothetical protein